MKCFPGRKILLPLKCQTKFCHAKHIFSTSVVHFSILSNNIRHIPQFKGYFYFLNETKASSYPYPHTIQPLTKASFFNSNQKQFYSNDNSNPEKLPHSNLQKESKIPLPSTSSSSSWSMFPSFSKSDFLRLILLAKPEYRLLGIGCGLLLASSAISMVVPFSIGQIIDMVTAGEPTHKLKFTLFFLGGIFLIGAVCNFGRVAIFRWCSEKIINRLRAGLFSKMVHQDLSFFDSYRTGDLLSRLSSDSSIVGKSVTNNVADGLRSIVQASVGGTMMFLVSPHLCGIIFSIIPPVVVAAALYGAYVKRLSKKTQTALAGATQVAEERLGNIKTVKSFSQEPKEVQLYESKISEVLKFAYREALASGSFMSAAALAANGSLLVVLWTAGRMVAEGIISVGDLSSFLMYTVYVGSSISGLSSFYTELMKGLGASSRLFTILDEKPKLKFSSSVGIRLENLQGKIEMQNVRFSYPIRPETPIFNGLSLVIEPGEVLAIVGSSGSGKSTIGSLLLRLYDPNDGNIVIDTTTSLLDIDISWWHDQIAVVSQEPVLFAGTIAENIAYGKPSATIEEIKTAAIQSNALSFIESFPKGLDTFVGERGQSLSGGQKQRIAIARACLKNPKILILDEATSALDSASEFLVQEALERLLAGRTVITIAHRMSTIQKANRIAVLVDGRIIETGTFHSLSSTPNSRFNQIMKT